MKLSQYAKQQGMRYRTTLRWWKAGLLPDYQAATGTIIITEPPQGARWLLGALAFFVPRLKKIWADAAYRCKELADWCQQQGTGWDLDPPGLHVQPRRCVVERCFAWLSRNRRLAKDTERKVQTRETLLEVATMRLVLGRLAAMEPRQPAGRADCGAL